MSLRVIRRAWAAPIFGGLGVWALLGDSPQDFTRIVITRPDTVSAHLGSLETWLDFLATQRPTHAGVLLWCLLGLLIVAWIVTDEYREAEADK